MSKQKKEPRATIRAKLRGKVEPRLFAWLIYDESAGGFIDAAFATKTDAMWWLRHHGDQMDADAIVRLVHVGEIK